MRRWLIALATALVAGALWVGAAYADDNIYHGNYNAGGWGATTSRCAGCHRAHTGSGPYLIKSATTYGLCTSCHGTANGLDVVDGVEWQTNSARAADKTVPPYGGIKGGGFQFALMNTSLTAGDNPATTTVVEGNPALNPAAPKAATSAHKINGMPNYTPGTVWGIGAPNSGAGTSVTLECTSCHDPHGGSGGVDPATGQRLPTYRILRSNVGDKVPGAGSGVVVPEDSMASHEFLVDSSVPLVGTAYPRTLGTAPAVYGYYYGQSYENTNMQTLSAWCATCHTRIHTAGDSQPATTPSGDTIYNFRHPTTGTSVENNLGKTVSTGTGLAPAEASGYPGCVTCHVAHGTSAVSSGRSAQVPKPGQAEGSGTANYLDSSLLRLDNHGVCEVCHNK